MKVDVSPQAATARLRQEDALHQLCLSLGRNGDLGVMSRTRTMYATLLENAAHKKPAGRQSLLRMLSRSLA